MRSLVLVVAVALGGLVGYVNGYHSGVSRPLSGFEKRSIAIEYACGPGQNWRMMKFFCGSTPKEERPTK